MADPLFLAPAAPLSIAEIAELTGARPVAGVRLAKLIGGVAALERAGPDDIAFFASRRYAGALARTRAGACFCAARDVALVPDGVAALEVDKPQEAFAVVVARLYPGALRPSAIFGAAGISPAAHVHPLARLEDGVTVEPAAVVGPGAELGRGSLIGPGAVIGPQVRIGRDTTISANAVVSHALIGDRVIVHPGVSIGQDGFGFVPGRTGHRKIAQIGRVIIQDDVEIGANSTVDRGSNRDTIVGEGTKIDNHCQIGHNTIIGRHCLIVGKSGISGTVTLGDYVFLGGGVGLKDNISIGDGARVAAGSGVLTDIPAGETWGGYPATRIDKWHSETRALRRLARRGAGGDGQGQADKEGNEPDER